MQILQGAFLIGPVQQLQAAIMMFDQCGAGFDPVTVITIQDIVDIRQLRPVQMTTDETIDIATPYLTGDQCFETFDIFAGVPDPVFQV